MPQINDEASPIARLIGLDGTSIVGVVYVWETAELAILWYEPKETAVFVDPELGTEVIAKAKAKTPVDVIAALCRLQILAKGS